MNKKDFWSLIACELVAVILLIEHFCDLSIALECTCIWTIISMIVHINILRNYVKIYITVED